MYLKSSFGIAGLAMLFCAQSLYSVDAIKKVGSAQELDALVKKGKPVIAKFYAPWCGACKMMAPAFEAVAEQYGDKVIFVEVNGEQATDLMDRYAINAYPTTIIFDARGSKVEQQTGSLSKDALIEHVEKVAAAPAKAAKMEKKAVVEPVMVEEEMPDVDDFILGEEEVIEPVAQPMMTKEEPKETTKECKPCRKQKCTCNLCKRCPSCKKDRKEKKHKTATKD